MKNAFLFKSRHATVFAKTLQPIHLINSNNNTFTEDLNNYKEQKRYLVGAIPFDINEKAALYTSDQVTHKLPDCSKDNVARHQYIREISYTPNKENYEKQVNNAIEFIKQKKINKLVLARSLEIALKNELIIDHLIHKFCELNPDGYTFLVPIDLRLENAHFLIGLSPELLIRKQGSMVTTNPLAGTIARGKNLQQDKANAKMLLHSAKDQFEHSLVVQVIKQILQPYCKELHIPDRPSLVSTNNLWHLSTFIQGELEDSSIDVLEIALQLHPTPAVGGHPKQLAAHYIKNLETIDRGLYTGLVGWSDARGDGEWAVTIRCAECKSNQLKLFAGAGIVEDSVAESEFVETAIKLNTMLIALGVDLLNQGSELCIK